MTLDELRDHITAVVAYNWPSEYSDALENGLEGHILVHLIALAEFVGDPPSDEERARLIEDTPPDLSSAMSPEGARSVVRPKILAGWTYVFYAEMQQEYEPPENRMRRFTNTPVKVIRLCGEDENDPENSPLYEVQAHDGTIFQAHEEELNGWGRDLGQFFWPDGTYGPDHDRSFLVNERTGDQQ